MDKKQAHFEAFGYEPLRMKPAHFASGFFMALSGGVHANELLNKVAVTKANKGLLDDYAPDEVLARLRNDKLIADTMAQADVELLRIQVNGVVNNDDAMYPAFSPYRPKGNDYTFISPRVLTQANRTDGYAGHFVATVLAATSAGREVLEFARAVSAESAGTLEHFVNPLLPHGEGEPAELAETYGSKYGELTPARIERTAGAMQTQTGALARLCENLDDHGRYRQIRYLVLGLLAWLMNHLLGTSAVRAADPILFFDFLGEKDGSIRSQSQTCYARLRETVRSAYRELAAAGRFNTDPVAERVFARRNREEDDDFRFLEQHFGDLALRMGYAQPRASRVPQKHFELQADTLRTLMLSVLDREATVAVTFEDVCARLKETWSVVVGGAATDPETLRKQGYFGFDEADLERNAVAFADRLKSLNLAVEPSDGLVLCSRDVGAVS